MMRGAQGYGPELRVRRKCEYTHAFSAGLSVRDPLLKILVVRNPTQGTRLGTAVSRRQGGAVERNRVRRRIREAFRRVRGDLPLGFDLIVVPLDVKRRSMRALETSLVTLAKRAEERFMAKERDVS